jgi:hypothetical protein
MGNRTTSSLPSNTNSDKENEEPFDYSSFQIETDGNIKQRKSSELSTNIKKTAQIRNEYLLKLHQQLQKENDEFKTKTIHDSHFGEYENVSSNLTDHENSNGDKLLEYSIIDASSITKSKKPKKRAKLTTLYKRFKKDNTIANDKVIIDLEQGSPYECVDNPTSEFISKRASDGTIQLNHSYFNEERLNFEDDDLESQYSKTFGSTKLHLDYEMIYVKDAENLRRSYIAKLLYKNIWTPSKINEKDHNTLIIFDWDDTLLCTSYLTPQGVFNEDLQLSDKDYEKLAKLESAVERLLTLAIGKGNTYIVTNAAPGWVEYSVNRFYPSIRKLLERITVISARGQYERLYPGDSRMWKIQAFLKMQETHDQNLVTNLICLGDSFIEMEAAHILASKYEQAYIKTIKFRESPKPEELHKQLLLVADQFSTIFSVVKNLTIRVEKKIK